jgi:uncharacterized protein
VHHVHVVSLDETIVQAQQLGGSVLRPKNEAAWTAWYPVVADPAGNIIAVWQADYTAFPSPEPH